MYARVGIITESHRNALVVPTNALVDANGSRGVYLAVNQVAQFRPVKLGIEGNERTEVLDGLSEGDRVVTTGAAGLRNGDPIILAGGGEGRGGRARGNRGGAGPGGPGGSISSGSEGSGAQGSSFANRGAGLRGGQGDSGAAAVDPGPRIADPGQQGTGTEGRRGGFRGRRGGQQ
jgi:hypothetical protein